MSGQGHKVLTHTIFNDVMPSHRITLRIEGPPSGQDNVRLSDFLEELEALRKTLRKTEEVLSGRTLLEWHIVDLRHNSPATVVLEPFLEDFSLPTAGEDWGGTVVGGFFDFLRALSAQEAPSELDSDALEAFGELAATSRKRRIRAIISNEIEPPIEIAPTIETTVRAVLAPTMKALGAVKGRLEFLNIHGESNVFRIYSPLLPRYIECQFPENLLSEARDALGFRVEVAGLLMYHTRDVYPRSIVVDSLRRLAEDKDLPRLTELRGVDPDATGEMSSEDFVRAMRSEE